MSVQWDEMPHLYGGLLLTRAQTWDYMTTYAYYPPLFDFFTAGYFQIFGLSHIAGRMVAVTFSLLSVVLIFEFSKRTLGAKTALLASILLGTMPGFFWVSRVTMLETMLVFFFSLAMFAFYSWIIKDSSKALLLSALTLGIGILAKYQIIVAVLAMIPLTVFLCRGRLKISLAKLLLIMVIAGLIVVPWFYAIYHYNGMKKFETIQYVMQEGGQDRPAYSNRFQPTPLFYMVEMTWPFSDIPVHPVTLPVFILGLCGLGLFAYRRKKVDIFLLTWFIVVYAFFTIVPNRQWRYVTPLFPVLAISAASFIMFLYGKISASPINLASNSKSRLRKTLAAVLILIVGLSMAYSSYEAYEMTARDQIHMPIEEVANYISSHLVANKNESAALLLPFNLFNQDMVRFYLPNYKPEQVWQYPELAVDAFKPDFNVTEFLNLVDQRNTTLVFIYDWGQDISFFNTTLTPKAVFEMLNDSGRFSNETLGTQFGPSPYGVYLLPFRSKTS